MKNFVDMRLTKLDPPYVVPLRVSTQEQGIGWAFSLHQGCSDKWFKHILPNLKSDTGRSNPLKENNK